MKILHVIPRLSIHDGGPPKAVREMARTLAERGHEVSIYTTDMVSADESPPPLNAEVAEGRATIRYFPLGHPRRWIRSPELGRALAQTIPNCDIVIIHALYHYHLWAAARLCRRFKVPYIIRPLGTLDPYIYRRSRWKKRLFEWLHQNRDLRLAAALHYTTEDEQRLAKPVSQGAPGMVVPLGIRPEEIGNAAHTASKLNRTTTLLHLGRLHEKKGIELLLQAIAKILPEHPELTCIIAGGPADYAQKLRALCAELGIAKRVTFPGFLSGKAKQQILSDADLFILPSYSENFGIAVIEAMAAGLPVLLSDQVNLHADVSDADAGWVVPASVEGITQGLHTALDARQNWKTIGHNGQQLVQQHYTWSTVAAQLEDNYSSIIHTYSSRR